MPGPPECLHPRNRSKGKPALRKCTSAALSRCATTVSARRIVATTGQELRHRERQHRGRYTHRNNTGRRQAHRPVPRIRRDDSNPTRTTTEHRPELAGRHHRTHAKDTRNTHRISLDPSGVSHTADPPTGANAKSRHHPTDTTNNANHPRKHANNTPLPVNDTRLCRRQRTGPHLLLYVLQFRQYGGQQTPSSSERVAHARSRQESRSGQTNSSVRVVVGRGTRAMTGIKRSMLMALKFLSW